MVKSRWFNFVVSIVKVKRTLVFTFYSALAFSVPGYVNGKEHECGIHNSDRFYIEEFPYTVSTYSHRLARITGSGVILNDNWILVTASQLYNHPAYDVMIRAGSDYGTVGGQYSRITKLITDFTLKHGVDLALLKTQEKLIFNKRVQPINIAEFVPQAGSKAMLSGFGKKENRSGELNAAQFEIVNPETCKWKYKDDTIICADAFDSYLSSDDLGDPLVQEKELVGLFVGSEGVWPYAFTPVARWRECILDAMKKNSAAAEDSDKVNESYYEGMDDDGDDD